MQIRFLDEEIIQKERQSELVQELQNSISCFQELHLSFVRFDVSVLLWSTSA
jgi:hypothetical protein